MRMTEQDKAVARRLSRECNDATYILGGMAAIGAFVNPGFGAAAGLVAAGIGYVGSRYGYLAEDPPRSDFDQLTTSPLPGRSGARSGDAPWSISEFAVPVFAFGRAVNGALMSLERASGIPRDRRPRFLGLQQSAIRQNLFAAAQYCEELQASAINLNLEWHKILSGLGEEPRCPSLGELLESMARHRRDPRIAAEFEGYDPALEDGFAESFRPSRVPRPSELSISVSWLASHARELHRLSTLELLHD